MDSSSSNASAAKTPSHVPAQVVRPAPGRTDPRKPLETRQTREALSDDLADRLGNFA